MTYLSDEQVQLLLKPIHPKRVRVRDGMTHVEGYDIRAELTRVFGFGRWSSEVIEQDVLCERETKTKVYKDKQTGEQKGGHPAWYVVYRSRMRLKVHAPDGTLLTFHDGSHVGASTHPDFGEAHGNALTNSETYALRRAAINLGDQFGLSLYNKGSMDAIVRWTLVRPEQAAEASATDTDDVPQVAAEDSSTPQAEDESAAGMSESAEPTGIAHAPQDVSEPEADGEAAPEDIDPDAQAFADEAHGAITLHEMEDIHRRAREAGKLSRMVRNPSANGTGKPGKLAIYLDWKRKQVKATEDALNELNAVVDETGFPVAELEAHVKSVTGTDLESASAAQLRQATQAMRVMQEPAA